MSAASLRGDAGARSRPRGRQLGHLVRQRRGIALEYEQVDLAEGVLDPARLERRALGAQDLLGDRRLRALVGVEEVLVEFLAGAHPDHLDADVTLGLEP